jgi:CheY-like chemotaxis protein
MIEVRSEPAPDLPPIMGVESEIREALTNLVFNAVDAMPDGGALTIRTGRRAGSEGDGDAGVARAFVEVGDTGVGMDEDTRRRCLEPFFTTKGERGTGLGLAMVYGMVQRHSADIEIESAPGKGTVFRLVFAAPATVSQDPVDRGASGARPDRMRLLVVDDDPLLIKSLRDTLEGDGHIVVAANGGQAGIDAFRAAKDRGEPFGAVITDLGMPYVDGRKVSEAIKAMAPSVPVILLTGWGQRLAAEGDVPPHVDRVLSKPPKLRELRAALHQLCPSSPQRES